MSEKHSSETDQSIESLIIDRRRFLQGTIGAATVGALSQTGLARDGEENLAPFADPEEYEALVEALPNNWGRWGDDDELGAINVLGSEEMFEGMNAATKRGKKGIERFTLQVPMTGVINRGGITEGERQEGDPIAASRTPAIRDNTGPTSEAEISGTGLNSAGDKFVTDLNLQGTSHMDSLGHVWVGSEIYNGFDAETTVDEKVFTGDYDGDGEEETIETRGLAKADITNAANAGIVGRGVLLDVARHVNGDDTPLDLGYDIGLEDLQATAESQGVDLRKHDIVLIRTGGLKRYYDPDYEWATATTADPDELEPGLRFEEELVDWVYEMEFPVLGADNIAAEKIVQTLESPIEGEGEKRFTIPLHAAFLQRLGVTLHEILWLEDLAASCAEDGISEFLFAGAPLNIDRGTGAPTNSLVVKATGNEKTRGK